MTTPTRSGCPLWAKIVLVVSLAANLAVAGLAIGHTLKDRRTDPGLGREVAWIIRLVPESKRDLTKRHLSSIRDELRESGVERDRHLTGIVTTIRNDTFDPDAFAAVLSERRSAAERRQQLVHDQLTTLMTEFTRDERRAFAANLEEQLMRMRARATPK